MKKKLKNNREFIFISFLLTSNAWAVGGSESTDLSNSTPPTRPAYLTEKTGFTLPRVASPTTSAPNQEKVFIERYTFSGNTVFDEKTLQEIAQPFTAHEIRIDELEELRQQITRHYIAHGYINSGARISKDALQHGDLHIDIVEGKLDDVNIHGQGHLREGYIKNRLLIDGPLNVTDLQDKFQLLLVDPLISTMKGSLLPSANSNSSLLEVDVTRARPYQMTLFSNN